MIADRDDEINVASPIGIRRWQPERLAHEPGVRDRYVQLRIPPGRILLCAPTHRAAGQFEGRAIRGEHRQRGHRVERIEQGYQQGVERVAIRQLDRRVHRPAGHRLETARDWIEEGGQLRGDQLHLAADSLRANVAPHFGLLGCDQCREGQADEHHYGDGGHQHPLAGGLRPGGQGRSQAVAHEGFSCVGLEEAPVGVRTQVIIL